MCKVFMYVPNSSLNLQRSAVQNSPSNWSLTGPIPRRMEVELDARLRRRPSRVPIQSPKVSISATRALFN